MNNESTLLVIFDPDNEEQPALIRAFQLFHDVENKISKILVLSNTYHEALGKNSVLKHDLRDGLQETCLQKHHSDLKNSLERLQKKYDIDIINTVKTQVTWHANIIHAVAEVCDNNTDIAFVLKSSQHHNLLERQFFTPLDWHLIRKSPIPVMLIKSDKPWQYKNQLVALDATAIEPQHRQLNACLMDFSQKLENQLSLDTHIVNAYPAMVDLALAYGGDTPVDIETNIESGHIEATKDYANTYNIENDHLHIWEGPTETVIEEAAKKCHADLIVMGTVGREGFANFLVGNTSEKVINHIDSDVMVLHIEECDM